MKDSILKGTGNSRFLKSAIPDGTTWAEALAMLRAGTFPMDLNGINNAGFQQVGTPLNKANLLKDVNALTLGLTGDAVPDDMFNVLAHAGDLHVWKKTVVTSETIPAGYTLGDATNQKLAVKGDGGTAGYSLYVYYCSTISVDDNGTVHPGTESSIEFVSSANMDRLNACKGKFIRMGSGKYSSYTEGEFFIPSDAVFSFTNNILTVNKCQKVNAYPLTPAGTTVTYPVSTNRNAYQEGSDAKPAGYTLGDVETGKFVLGTGVGSNAQNMFYISSSVTVDDSGNISQENQGSTYINGESGNTMQGQANNVIGKFVVLNSKQSNSDFDVGTIWYIPPDVTIRNSYSTDGEAYDQYNIINYVTKRQRVTGYAAIPVNTTIEYLGALGEKAIIEMGSYVGTGTYGLNNKNKIQFKKSPKLLIVQNIGDTPRVFITLYGGKTVSPTGSGTSSSGQLHITWSDTSVSWYAGTTYTQLNDSGQTYNYLLVY